MRRLMLLGGWYAMLFAALVLAEPRRVSTQEAPLRAGPSDYTDPVGTVKAGDVLEATGKAEEGFVQVRTKDGKVAWISDSDLFSLKQEELMKSAEGTGGGAGAEAEGAYVKGFDPEVEGQMRADNPGLNTIFETEVLPWIALVRGGGSEGAAVSRQLEDLEEMQEKYLIQANAAEAEKLQPQIDELRRKVQPFRDSWQNRLRGWRQAGQIGEFARRK
ncbi:MAG: SH3 domain-containing protein [Planctomycetia bacterium]|nr:SH3 domain-containing protein [Planctomycetia bacterium]